MKDNVELVIRSKVDLVAVYFGNDVTEKEKLHTLSAVKEKFPDSATQIIQDEDNPDANYYLTIQEISDEAAAAFDIEKLN